MQRREAHPSKSCPDRSSHIRRAGAALLLLALTLLPFQSRADTVASLLGNFTINQFCGLNLADGSIKVHYTVVFGQLPALAELHRADANGDGVTSQAERDAYVQRLAPEFARQLRIVVDDVAVPIHLKHWTSSLPTEQGGFSLRLDADFVGALRPSVADRSHTLNFTNRNFDSRFGWNEITVQAIAPVRVFNANGFSTSLTAGLTQALLSLPPGGPLDERVLNLSFTKGAIPTGSTPLPPRPGTSQAQVRPMSDVSIGWLQQKTRALIDLISAPHVPLHITLLALLAAFALGALHAFSPGHGKTIVGAYLIGARGTPRHAAFLGLTVTITHTLGVFIVGFATLFASRFIVPERLFPILSLLSGMIVLAMGMILLAQRWRLATGALGRRLGMHPAHSYPSMPSVALAGGAIAAAGMREDGSHGHAHSHGTHSRSHDHGDHHQHGHSHAAHEHSHGLHDGKHFHGDSASRTHDAALTHSHGGSVHSHLPPGTGGTEVTWRSLLALGISGGLLPCPSAMVLLLAAAALNKTAYGMLLVLGFSVGLAVTLSVVGLAFIYARSWFRRPRETSRWPVLLPVMSAGVITVLGVVLCLGALQIKGW